MREPGDFDDFLRLAERPFAEERLVVFCGNSGSGKTTAIRHLVENHPAFERGRFVVIDELTRFRELALIARLLAERRRVVAASHLPHWAFLPFGAFVPLALFQTDRGSAKLGRYLERHGLTYSAEALARYERRYGAVYTEIDILRELVPDASFDRMLRRFDKLHRVVRRPVRDGTGPAVTAYPV